VTTRVEPQPLDVRMIRGSCPCHAPVPRGPPKIFTLLAEKRIDPLISRRFPLLEARAALELLATGTVEGKLVLEADR